MFKTWKRGTKYGIGIVVLLILLGFLWGGVEENMVEEVPIAEPVTRMDLERSLLDSVAGFSGPIEPKIQFALLEEFEVEPELVFSSGFWMGLGIAGSAMGLVLGTILGSKALEESKKRSKAWKKHPNWHSNRDLTSHARFSLKARGLIYHNLGEVEIEFWGMHERYCQLLWMRK